MADCDVVVADPRSSHRHAEIRPSGSGFVITDLGSMNGTLVNGAPIREQPLADGDDIRLGNTMLRFEAS
jgi:pSer/pThr/pTyr-binding forkhead associated (FHA) protein